MILSECPEMYAFECIQILMSQIFPSRFSFTQRLHLASNTDCKKVMKCSAIHSTSQGHTKINPNTSTNH